jgi:isopenicillin-N N-acyltransferase like protein
MTSANLALPIFRLAADPSHQRGEYFGQMSRQHVERSMGLYRDVIPFIANKSWTELVDLAGPFVEAARQLDAGLVHDLEGLAVGAGVSFDDVAVLCARSELLQLGDGPPIGECTTVVDSDRIGQTWDWFVSQLDACVVWHTPQFVAFAEGGMPPKIGVNASGVAVTLNFLSTTLQVDRNGVPVHALLHHLLERATSTGDAIERLMSAPTAGCAAIGLLDSSGDAAVVELAPHGRTAVLPAGPSVGGRSGSQRLVQTNHCLSSSLTGLDAPGLLLNNSVARFDRARQLADDDVTIEELLSDNDGGWHPIALSADASGPLEEQLGTVSSVIIDTVKRTLLIAPGNPAQVGFTQLISLENTVLDNTVLDNTRQ